MKCIAIFEDNKGFSKVLEFAQLPHKYDFIEYKPASVAFSADSSTTSNFSQDTKITFFPNGKPEKVYGIITQHYKQMK